MNFSKARISYIITHEISNKLRNEGFILSKKSQVINNDTEKLILNFFYNSFESEDILYKFTHSSDLNLNEVYIYSKNIFNNENENCFIEYSHKIAKHLYEYSVHPKITRGELIIVKINNILYNNSFINAIGIFKSERKEPFLTVLKNQDNLQIKDNRGIGLSKIDKGCLILEQNEKDGYMLFSIDNQSKQTDYWIKKFLNITFYEDNNFKTKNIINLCKKFSDTFILEKYGSSDKIQFNNRFINFFEEEEFFNIDSFKNKVFNNEVMKKEFDNYFLDNFKQFELKPNDKFLLSKDEIKKEKKKIKNIIKLDTKLELKVLLDKEDVTKNIEKGYDEQKGMSYYKIYFNEEL